MKKNLKKVISAVIALALSASTFASVSFAKSFSDVASTASYAEAVDVLSALGIINGYEDGTFGPDKTIKRSEAAKIIVAMVNKIATAEGRKGATQFDDVAADHWASGFINVGVSDKFINGKSATKFDPDGQVKYNEIVKMIVSCLGYEEYAQFYGGYPTGYVAIADSEGITKGCSMDGEGAATRAVVAQLVYNALKTPVIQSKGMQYSAAQGGFVPNIEKQDGEESKYFKTLLTDKFDAYFVQGTVTATAKDGSADLGEVKFDLSNKVERFDHEDIGEINSNGGYDVNSNPLTVLVGDTAAADYLNVYANAIMQYTEDEEWVFVSFIPSGKNKIATLDLALVDDDKYTDTEILDALNDSTNPYIYVYSSEDSARSTKYKLEKGFDLYVNGIKEDTKDFQKYIIDNHVGVMELTDTYGSEDGYDIVSVEYYDTVKVSSVSSKSVYITKNKDGLNASSISIDPEKLEEGDIVMNVYLNDEKVNASEIKKDDILSIKYDVTNPANTLFYDIYISRDTAEGKFSGKDTEDKLVTIGGEKYAFVDWTVGNAVFDTNRMGNEYKVYLDKFGRIYEQEELASTAKFAIAVRAYDAGDISSWDNGGLRLYLTDGTVKNVEYASTVKVEGEATSIGDLLTKIGKSTVAKANIPNQIVRYTINTAGKLSKVTLLKTPAEKDADFDADNKKIGNIIMNDATVILDVSDYSANVKDITAATVNTLVNDVNYKAYAYGDPSASDNSYPFVLIVDGKGAYTEETAFAVVTKDIYPGVKDDGEDGQYLEVLYEGDEIQTLFVDEDFADDSAKAGDVVVLQLDADGDVKEYKVVYHNVDFGTEDFVNSVGDYKDGITLPSTDWDTAWVSTKEMETSLVFGPIVERNGRKYLAQVADNKTKFDLEPTKGTDASEGATLGIITTDDTNVYVYDINAARKDRFFKGTANDIIATQVDHITDLATDGYYTIDWTIKEDGRAADDQVNFAFAKLVDGVVTDIFVIVGLE